MLLRAWNGFGQTSYFVVGVVAVIVICEMLAVQISDNQIEIFLFDKSDGFVAAFGDFDEMSKFAELAR